MAPPKRTLITATTLLSRRSIPLCQPCWHYRPFTTTPHYQVNPLQNLSHFSAAKEAQFLSKEKRIPREEFHPYLQLIRSSEVDPFAPVPGASPTVIAALNHAKSGEADTDSALRLAVSNLIDQVKASNREKEEILRALVQVQARYRREERNALGMLFAVVGALAFVMVKTRAVEDLVGLVSGVSAEGDEFSWGWLGSSSEHLPRLRPGGMEVEPEKRDTKEPVGRLEEVGTRNLLEEPAQRVETILSVRGQPESRGLFSRLFWASSGAK